MAMFSASIEWCFRIRHLESLNIGSEADSVDLDDDSIGSVDSHALSIVRGVGCVDASSLDETDRFAELYTSQVPVLSREASCPLYIVFLGAIDNRRVIQFLAIIGFS